MIKTAKQQQNAMKKTKKDIVARWKQSIEEKINKQVSLGYFDVTVKVSDYVLSELIDYFRSRGYYCTLTKKGLFISWHKSYVK